MGASFRLGPGGKGSNQAVAAARAGARVSFISKLGHDAFGDLARTTYRDEAIDATYVFPTTTPTGAAVITTSGRTARSTSVTRLRDASLLKMAKSRNSAQR